MAKTVSWIFEAGMLFRVACEHARLIDAPPRQGDQKPALVSIVFAVLTLEAFLNEMAEYASDPDVEKPKVVEVLCEFLTDAEGANASLETKFAVGNWILTGAKLERGEQPFQDFGLLVRLRNDLVHFKANDKFEDGISTGKRHANLVSKFRDKRILAEDTRADKLLSSWSHLIQTKAVAEWSCRTAANMVMDFYRKIPPGDFRDAIVPYEQHYDADKLFSDSWKSEVPRRVKYYCHVCGWASEWVPDTASKPPHECRSEEHEADGGDPGDS